MRYSLKYLSTVWIGLALFLACVAFGLYRGLVVANPKDPTIVFVPLLGFVFFLCILPMIVRTSLTRLDVTDDGLVYRSWFGRHTRIDWNEIEQVKNHYPKSYFMVTGGAKRISVDHYYAENDLTRFAELCKQRLRPDLFGEAFEQPISNSIVNL
jgi:hypothetical protein